MCKVTRDLQDLRRALADLLASRNRLVARVGTFGDGPPRLRLQDWRVLEELSIGSNDYVVLRRVRGGKHGVRSLTTREKNVVHHVCAGLSNKEIAHQLGISSSTVRVLLSRAIRKVGVPDRDHLIKALSLRPVGDPTRTDTSDR